MIKKIIALSVTSLCFYLNGFGQQTTFTQITKGGRANDFDGWGINRDVKIDSRPYSSPEGSTYVMNAHRGLTLSAHSVYGGSGFIIRDIQLGRWNLQLGQQ